VGGELGRHVRRGHERLAGAGAWTSTGCPVQEAFSSWPAMLTPVAFDAGSDVTANFTASDGVSGQPYVLLGHPVSAATAALAPGTGGEVALLSAVGGSNPAAPGVNQATAADPVNTESGDLQGLQRIRNAGPHL
jgi:hypothetical protein